VGLSGLELVPDFFPVSHHIFRKKPMNRRRITRAPAAGIISRWSDVAIENTVRIAEGVYAIPMAVIAKNNHLSFLRPSYFIGLPETLFDST